ncbi:MAG: hypothetical protein AAGA92_04450 [Planctomycetota bacterium]
MQPPHPLLRQRLRGAAAACAALLLACTAACDTAGPVGAATAKPKPPPKPEDRLKMVVQRLERALSEFRPSGAEGLKTRSDLSYEFVSAGAGADEPRAVITIVTDTLYRGGVGSPGGGADEQEREPDPDDAGPAGNVRALPVTQKEKTRHELVFRQGAWQLDSQPEKSYEEIWFEYALATEIPLETE